MSLVVFIFIMPHLGVNFFFLSDLTCIGLPKTMAKGPSFQHSESWPANPGDLAARSMFFGPCAMSHSKITSFWALLLMGLRYKDEVEIKFHVISFKKAVTYMIGFRGISFKTDKINISELNEISFRYLKNCVHHLIPWLWCWMHELLLSAYKST